MYRPEYIEALQAERREQQKENKATRFQRNISFVLNIALIISIIILGQQIEKLSGIITGL
jgi:hypothetical protein